MSWNNQVTRFISITMTEQEKATIDFEKSKSFSKEYFNRQNAQIDIVSQL